MNFGLFAQQNSIEIKADLLTKEDVLNIKQKIRYYNSSKDTLKQVYLHNWSNSYKDRETPLSKRFRENYNRSLYFAKQEELGYTKIENIKVNGRKINYIELKNQSDIFVYLYLIFEHFRNTHILFQNRKVNKII